MVAVVALSLLLILDLCAGLGLWQAGLGPLALLAALLPIHLLVAAGITRALIAWYPIREGRFRVGGPESRRWLAQALIMTWSYEYISPLIPFFWKPLVYRLFGARIGRGVVIIGRMVDCSLITLEDHSTVGTDAILLGHYVASGWIHIGRVILRRGALAGVRSVVFPKVTMGEDSLLGALSLAPWGRQIPPGEVWIGNPARPVARGAGQLDQGCEPGTASSLNPITSGQVRAETSRRRQAPCPGDPRLVADELRAYLQGELALSPDGLSDQDPGGLYTALDSIALTQLLCFLEERYGLRIGPDEATKERFSTPATLARFLVSRGSQAQGLPDPPSLVEVA